MTILTSSYTNRSPTLDVVRGIAILSVVAVHSWEQAWEILDSPVIESSVLFQLVSLLRYGVELFFALSGWLIFSLYYKRADIGSRAYWSRRLLRIWPLWIFFSLATILVLTNTDLKFPMGIEPVGQQPSLLLGTILVLLFLGWLTPFTWETTPGGWSIQVEMGHYLLFWPLRRLAPFAIASTILIGYATYFIARAFATRSPEEFGTAFARSWIRLGLYGTWPFFVVGGLVYLWSTQRFSLRTLYYGQTVRSRWSYSVVTGVILLTALFIPVPFGTTYEAVLSVLVLLMVAIALLRSHVLTKLLSSLGKYSYFIYFAHFWVLAEIMNISKSIKLVPVPTIGLIIASMLLTLVSLFVSWSFGLLSWRVFESPLMKVARKVPANTVKHN